MSLPEDRLPLEPTADFPARLRKLPPELSGALLSEFLETLVQRPSLFSRSEIREIAQHPDLFSLTETRLADHALTMEGHAAFLLLRYRLRQILETRQNEGGAFRLPSAGFLIPIPEDRLFSPMVDISGVPVPGGLPAHPALLSNATTQTSRSDLAGTTGDWIRMARQNAGDLGETLSAAYVKAATTFLGALKQPAPEIPFPVACLRESDGELVAMAVFSRTDRNALQLHAIQSVANEFPFQMAGTFRAHPESVLIRALLERLQHDGLLVEPITISQETTGILVDYGFIPADLPLTGSSDPDGPFESLHFEDAIFDRLSHLLEYIPHAIATLNRDALPPECHLDNRLKTAHSQWLDALADRLHPEKAFGIRFHALCRLEAVCRFLTAPHLSPSRRRNAS